MTTITEGAAFADAQVVRAGYDAVAAGDIAAFARGYHTDATWNHRNPDQLGGIKHGIDEIVSFMGASVELTAGTLKPVPELFMSDGEGHVAVLTHIIATRPDGRSLNDTQMLYFQLEDGKVRSVDQFIGDPPAVTAFWA